MLRRKKRDRDELMPGTLELLILKTLSRNSLHGYAIAQHIQSTTEDVLQIEEGSLYPALQRLEQKGWIVAEWGTSDSNRRARFYTLTRDGRQQLARETSQWRRLASAIGRILGPEVAEG